MVGLDICSPLGQMPYLDPGDGCGIVREPLDNGGGGSDSSAMVDVKLNVDCGGATGWKDSYLRRHLLGQQEGRREYRERQQPQKAKKRTGLPLLPEFPSHYCCITFYRKSSNKWMTMASEHRPHKIRKCMLTRALPMLTRGC